MKNIKYYNNSVIEGYYDHIFKKNKGIQSAWHHIKFNYVKRKISQKNFHLDVGCGPGTFIGILNIKSVGIDVAKNQVLYAKKNYGNKKKKFLFFKNTFPLKSKSVDSISLIELIEHIDNKDLTFLLHECRRVLKNKGKIFCTTPNYFSLWPILEIFLNLISPVDYKHEHINKFNKKKLNKILIENGFKVSELNSFILFSPFLASLSFKLALWMINFDNVFTKIFPGFLLFAKAEKI